MNIKQSAWTGMPFASEATDGNEKEASASWER